jgi:ABC-type sugar transport system ATPase subunit
MNILAGELQPDAGQILYRGNTQEIRNPYVSQQLGIHVVYQELALCPNLTVAENICLNNASTTPGFGVVNHSNWDGQARKALARLRMEALNPHEQVSRLGVAQQQMVEIAKAISSECRVLILDEPNSALTIEETQRLFEVLRALRADGVAIIYVSHRLEEVLGLADRITVLRDGRFVETLPAAGATVDQLISRMVGREIDSLYHRTVESAARGAIALEVSDLSSGKAVQDISFKVQQGEIVGFAGLPDAGRDELVDCLFGLRPINNGSITVAGHMVRITSPMAAIRHGLALVPADRRKAGALLEMDVNQNIAASSLSAVSKAGMLVPAAVRRLGQKYAKELDIRAASMSQRLATLSGGNQQKAILARGLATRPAVLLLHEPTRGIDVGAKGETYTILQSLARQGVAIVIFSSELQELMGQCDRILVMHGGRLTGHFLRSEFHEEPILACAMGQFQHLPA